MPLHRDQCLKGHYSGSCKLQKLKSLDNEILTLTHYDILLNIRNLYAYIKHLQINKNFTASTVSEKLRRLRQAIQYTKAKENSLKINQKLFNRCQLIAGL